MKKLIIMIFLLMPVRLFAGEMHGELEAGHFVKYEAYYVKILLEYHFPIWVFKNIIYGGWKTEFQLPDDGWTINTIIADIYTIGHKIQYKDVYFRTEHECRHAERSREYTYSITTISIGVEW